MENRTEQNSIGQKSSFSIYFGSLLRIRVPILLVRVQDFAMWHGRGDPRDMPRRVLTPTHAGEAQLNLIDEYAMLTRMQPFGPLLGSDTQLMVPAGLSEHGSATPTLIFSPRVQHAIQPWIWAYLDWPMTASRSDSCLDEVNSQKRLSEAGIRLPSPGTIMCSRYQAVHLDVFGPPPNPVAWRMAVVEKGRSYRPGESSRITDLLTATSLRGLTASMLPLRVRCLRRAGWRARRGTTLYLDDHVYL